MAVADFLMKTLMTQRQAKKILRPTGLSIRSCEERIAAMPKVPDGKLLKVHIHHVHEVIKAVSAPPKVDMQGIRPLSSRVLGRISIGTNK